jgi:cytochrome c556
MRTGFRIAIAALLAATAGAAAQVSPPQPPQAQQPAQQQRGPASSALSYVPGIGDMMNLLVQPRHAKLGIAARERNWDLAAYALKELDQAFSTVAKVQPKYRNFTVSEAIESMTGEAMRNLDDAVRARNMKQFTEAYGELTDGCNSCHTALNLPFIVIKPPEASSFPNQDFTAH